MTETINLSTITPQSESRINDSVVIKNIAYSPNAVSAESLKALSGSAQAQLDRIVCLEAKIARYEKALGEIAMQRLSQDCEENNFDEAYDMCIETARKALEE